MKPEEAAAVVRKLLDECPDARCVAIRASLLRALVDGYEAAKCDIEEMLAQDEWEGQCQYCAKITGICHKGYECKPEWRGPEPEA